MTFVPPSDNENGLRVSYLFPPTACNLGAEWLPAPREGQGESLFSLALSHAALARAGGRGWGVFVATLGHPPQN